MYYGIDLEMYCQRFLSTLKVSIEYSLKLFIESLE